MITETIPCSGFAGFDPNMTFEQVEETIPKILEKFCDDLSAAERHDLNKSLYKKKLVGTTAHVCLQFGYLV